MNSQGSGERRWLERGVRLLGNRVIIAPTVREQSAGGILFARMSRQMPYEGVVLHISDKARAMWDNQVQPGTKVIFNRNHQQLAEDEKTTQIDAKHLLAIVT